MRALYGQCKEPFIILHGGAGPQDPTSEGLKEAGAKLVEIGTANLALLRQQAYLEVACGCLGGMEECSLFNAGYGSALQADGQARLTAAVMDGERQSFSAVISTQFIRHPSQLARHLQSESSRVLTAPGTELLARKLGMPVQSNLSAKRTKKWFDGVKTAAGSFDTVGCVVWADGRLVTGTSTGGRGFEFPGRVSDSGTVAGTYGSKHAGISATGIGEEIVDDGLCVRIETRCRDGLSLGQACEKTLAEAKARRRQYGWIAADAHGHWAIVHTTPAMSYALLRMDGEVLAICG